MRLYNGEIMKQGFFDKPLLKSRVKSVNVKLPELLLGYFIGPIGALLASGIFSSGLLNNYYTEVLFAELLTDPNWSGKIKVFLSLLPVLSAILIVAGNLCVGQLIQRTNTAAGKSRPWILASSLTLSLISIFMFAMPLTYDPSQNAVLTMVLTAVGYNLFYAVAYPMYYTANSSLVPVSTRNGKQRGLLASASNMAMTTAIGAGGMVVPILLGFLIKESSSPADKRFAWFVMFLIIGVVAFVAVILQYYFTRERVNEENMQVAATQKEKISVKKQFKAVASDKFWWIILCFCCMFQFAGALKNASLVYYVKTLDNSFLSGLTSDGDLSKFAMSLVNIIGAVPMTLAVALVWPLSNKFGKRPVVMCGLIVNVIGNVICAIGGKNVIVVFVGVFFKALGSAPGCYMMLAMISDALDHAEAKNGFRCDGLTMSIYASIMIASTPLATGLLNAITQAGTNAAMSSVCYIWIECIVYAALCVLMMFNTVEKHAEEDQQTILEHQKQAALAAGIEWVEPAERLRREQEEADRIAEEARIAELKARCDKKGLDFDAELAKMRAREEAKNNKKSRKK